MSDLILEESGFAEITMRFPGPNGQNTEATVNLDILKTLTVATERMKNCQTETERGQKLVEFICDLGFPTVSYNMAARFLVVLNKKLDEIKKKDLESQD